MVNAPECTREAIGSAIDAGRFYSTCGPDFHAIEYSDGSVTVRTSPVRFVRLVGPQSFGKRIGSFDGSLLTEGILEIPADWLYAYVEIEDAQGRLAWTNPLFMAE